MKLSRMQTWLLLWSALALAATLIMRQVELDERATVIVGVVEVVIAIATGIAFGLSVSTRKRN